MHNPCAVIPVYNHETAITTVVDALLANHLPCILVDDASSPPCACQMPPSTCGASRSTRPGACATRERLPMLLAVHL